jgi:hypothetical protein
MNAPTTARLGTAGVVRLYLRFLVCTAPIYLLSGHLGAASTLVAYTVVGLAGVATSPLIRARIRSA